MNRDWSGRQPALAFRQYAYPDNATVGLTGIDDTVFIGFTRWHILNTENAAKVLTEGRDHLTKDAVATAVDEVIGKNNRKGVVTDNRLGHKTAFPNPAPRAGGYRHW